MSLFMLWLYVRRPGWVNYTGLRSSGQLYTGTTKYTQSADYLWTSCQGSRAQVLDWSDSCKPQLHATRSREFCTIFCVSYQFYVHSVKAFIPGVYNIIIHYLTITVYLHYFADPYVKVNLMQQDRRLIKWKTSVKKNTLTPIFYESARFDVTRLDLESIYFDILIMDHDRVGRNSILGVVKLGHKVSHTSGEYQWRCALNNPNQLCNTWHCISPIQKGASSPSLRRSKSPSCINVGTQIWSYMCVCTVKSVCTCIICVCWLKSTFDKLTECVTGTCLRPHGNIAAVALIVDKVPLPYS